MDTIAESWREEIQFRNPKGRCSLCGKKNKLTEELCFQCKEKKLTKRRLYKKEIDKAYCQNNLCPKRFKLYDREKMIEFNNLLCCSEKCKDHLMKKWNETRMINDH